MGPQRVLQPELASFPLSLVPSAACLSSHSNNNNIDVIVSSSVRAASGGGGGSRAATVSRNNAANRKEKNNNRRFARLFSRANRLLRLLLGVHLASLASGWRIGGARAANCCVWLARANKQTNEGRQAGTILLGSETPATCLVILRRQISLLFAFRLRSIQLNTQQSRRQRRRR